MKVEADVPGRAPSLIILTVSVDVKQHLNEKKVSTVVM